jgi:uncharacterized OB-fold protein
MMTKRFSKTGRLISYTVIQVAAPEFEIPLVVGYVDLPEKIRLFSMLIDCEPHSQKLKLDMSVEMTFGMVKKDDQGTEIWSYKFKPLEITLEKGAQQI